MASQTKKQSQEGPVVDRTGLIFYLSKLVGKQKTRIDLTGRVLSFEYTDGGKTPKQANKTKMVVEDRFLENSAKKEFQRGDTVVVQWGRPGAMGPEREVVLRKVHGNHKLVLEGLARSAKMHGEQKSRVFNNKKKSEVFKQVAKEAGYDEGSELDIEDTEVVYETLAQTSETDAELLHRYAAEEGFELFDDVGVLHFRRATMGSPPVQRFVYYTSNRGDIIKFDTEGTFSVPAVGVSVKAYDTKTRTTKEGKGSNTDTKRQGNSPTVTRTSVLGTQQNNRTRTDKFTTTNPSEADRKATRKFITATRSNYKLKLDVVGDANILARTVIDVQNIGQEESGRYYLSSVKHVFKPGTYTCHCEGKTDHGQGEKSKAKVAPGATDKDKLEEKVVVLGTGAANRQRTVTRRARATGRASAGAP